MEMTKKELLTKLFELIRADNDFVFFWGNHLYSHQIVDVDVEKERLDLLSHESDNDSISVSDLTPFELKTMITVHNEYTSTEKDLLFQGI